MIRGIMLSLISFLATVIIEFIIYFIWFREKPQELLLCSLLINSLTWPIASIFFGIFNRTSSFFIIEIMVFLAEIFLLKSLIKITWWKAILLSLIANFVTAFLGIFLSTTYQNL